MSVMTIAMRRGADVFRATLLTWLAAPAILHAQVRSEAVLGANPLRVSVITGGLTPRSAVIVAAQGGGDTRLSAGPMFGVDLQYRAFSLASLFGGVAAAFGTLEHGSNLGIAARATSSDAVVILGTGGLVFDAPDDWFGESLTPFVRLGGGLKRYSFSTPGAESFITGTGDFGLGFRAGTGSVELGAEVRYLPSAFDQSNLPTRGIVTQKQRQNDLLFGIGVTVRP